MLMAGAGFAGFVLAGCGQLSAPPKATVETAAAAAPEHDTEVLADQDGAPLVDLDFALEGIGRARLLPSRSHVLSRNPPRDRRKCQ